MARPDGRIEPGQPLRGAISARAWNRAQDAADLVLGAAPAAVGAAQSYSWGPFTSVLATTDEGFDMSMGYAYSIKGVSIEPVDDSSTSSFLSMPVIKTTTPYRGGSKYSYCVALEPIQHGSIGRVAIDGVVGAVVEITSDYHNFANFGSTGNGDSPMLMSSYVGGTQILWKPPVPSSVGIITALCLVRMHAAFPQVRAGTVATSAAGQGSWNTGTYKTVVLDDATGLPSSSVGVFNAMQSVYVYDGARAYVFCNGGSFELLAVHEHV